MQKPISVDIVEGEAMLTAARKHNRVVEVGTQRRSTPHLIEARENIIQQDKLGHIGLVEIYCYYQMRNSSNPPDTAPPDYLDYDLWTGPAPMRPHNLHRPSSRLAGVHGARDGVGIVGDMCWHMFDMTRWMLDLGWPKSISVLGRHSSSIKNKVNISDTQTAVWGLRQPASRLAAPHMGNPPDPEVSVGATFYYGDKGTLKRASA